MPLLPHCLFPPSITCTFISATIHHWSGSAGDQKLNQCVVSTGPAAANTAGHTLVMPLPLFEDQP